MSKRGTRPVSSYSSNQRVGLRVVGRPASAKDIFEAANRKRNIEFQKLKNWEEVADSFRKKEIQAKIYSNLLSHNRNGNLTEREIEERQEQLEIRRNRMRNFLRDEEKKYQKELEKLAPKYKSSGGNIYPEIEALKLQLDQLKKKNMEERKKMSEKLSFELWKKNNPELRQMESDRLNKFVQDAWVNQKLWKDDERRKYEEERKKEAAENEIARRKELEKRKAEEAERMKNIADKKAALDEQATILREQKLLETKIEEEIVKLQKEEHEVEALAKNRQQEVSKHRLRKDLEHFWARQHQLKLKKKSLLIQEELLADEKVVEELIRNISHDISKEDTLQEANWIKGIIEEQKNLEKLREKEYELLFSEEAENMWNKRQSDWDREQQARDKLMADVMASWRKQVEDNISEKQRSIQESRENQLIAKSTIESIEESVTEEPKDMQGTYSEALETEPIQSEIHLERSSTEQKYHNQRIEEHKKEIKKLEEQMEALWSKSYEPPRHGRKKTEW